MDDETIDEREPGATDGGDPAEQLRNAALEAVRAARALLDAAEAVITDPRAIEGAMRTVGSMARTATEAVAGFAADVDRWGSTTAADPSATADGDGGDDDDGPIQHIPVG